MAKGDWVFWIFGAAGVAGLVMIIFGFDIRDDRWSTVATHIGIAFVAAAVVGSTIELYVRRQMQLKVDKMLEDVGKDVFRFTLGHLFPESIWNQVQTYLLRNPVIRRDMRIEYSLEQLLEPNGDFLRAQMCFDYTVSNLDTTTEQVYPIVSALDRCLDSRFHDQADFTKVEIDGNPLGNESLSKEPHDTEIICKTNVTLKAGQTKRVTICAQSVYPCTQVIPFSMTDPTENLEIVISKPPNIEVHVDPLHPREQRLREVPTASPVSRRSWRIVGGVLPGQGVNIRWFTCNRG